MEKFKNVEVREKFGTYPKHIREKLLLLRQLVIDTASEIKEVGKVEEALKWGEPSYIANGGSTIRMGWKKSNPNSYFMYFYCKTKISRYL